MTEAPAFAGPAPSAALIAAHDVFAMLSHVRYVMLDAENKANDGRLLPIARWIRERIDSLDCELLPEVTATVKALEKREAEAKAAAQ